MPNAKVKSVSSRERKHERHSTVRAVRFVSAQDFVTEYAENLSAGGIFIRQAHQLEPLSEITIHIDLAGYDSFKVKAQVAHVLSEEMAAKMGRAPGAGLQLTSVPDGFEDALRSYMARLGRRRDYLVLTDQEGCTQKLADAGFLAATTDMASVTEQSLSASNVLAVVVDKEVSNSYREILAVSPKPAPVIGCYFEIDEEPLLVELDRLVVAQS